MAHKHKNTKQKKTTEIGWSGLGILLETLAEEKPSNWTEGEFPQGKWEHPVENKVLLTRRIQYKQEAKLSPISETCTQSLPKTPNHGMIFFRANLHESNSCSEPGFPWSAGVLRFGPGLCLFGHLVFLLSSTLCFCHGHWASGRNPAGCTAVSHYSLRAVVPSI